MATDVLTTTNQKLLGSFKNTDFLNAIGWFVFLIIIIAVAIFVYIWYKDKRLYRKKITALEIIGETFIPTISDTAKVVKIGSGGFEILYLKKQKTWKIAYGGRVGKDSYYFFIMPDGYWYNAMLSANMYWIDKLKGFIPIVTTNPSMRSQYTALEKQIDALHQDKKGFMDKYGIWIFSIGFLVVAGIFLWLSWKEQVQSSANFKEFGSKLIDLVDRLNTMQGNAGGSPSGLVPVK